MSTAILIEESPICLRAARLEGASDDAWQVTALRHLFMGRDTAIQGELYRAKVTGVDKRLGAAYLDLGGQDGFLRRSGPLPEVGRSLMVEVRREAIGGKGADVSDRPALRLPMTTVLLDTGDEKPGPLGEEPADERLRAALAEAGPVGLADPRPSVLRLLMTLLDSSVREISVTRPETKIALAPFLPEDVAIEFIDPAEAADILDEAEEDGLAIGHGLPGGGRMFVEETAALFAVDLDLGNQSGQSGKGAGTKMLGEALGTLGRLGNVIGLGGQIIIDIPRGAIAAPKIVRDQITRALKPLGRVSVPAVTPEGIAVVIAPRPRPSLREVLTEPGADALPGRIYRDDQIAAHAFRVAERTLEDDRTASVRLFVTNRAIPLLADGSAALHDLVSRFGARLTVEGLEEGDPRGDIHVEV